MENEIISYYRKSDWLYKYFWHQGKSLGLHHGIDNADTKTLNEAIENHYKVIVKEGEIKKGMKILDAGCGVGGASIYIARQTGAALYGISLVPEQILSAEKYAKRARVEELTNFSVMDYTKTPFPDNYFDIVFGIESICYSFPKEKFLKEAKRILKKSGKLIIIDGYKIHPEKNEKEKEITKNFCWGWKLNEMIEESSMVKKITKSGFKITKTIDNTNRLTLSKKRYYWLVFIGQFFPFLPGVRDNILAIRSVLAGLDVKLFGHFTHIAVKK